MKLLLLSAASFVGTMFSIFSDTAATTKQYIMVANGEQGDVTLVWKNIRGLGTVEGEIEGNPMVGKNPRSGELQLCCEGIYIDLVKVRQNGRFQWQGVGYNENDCSEFLVTLIPAKNHNRLPTETSLRSGGNEILASAFSGQ